MKHRWVGYKAIKEKSQASRREPGTEMAEEKNGSRGFFLRPSQNASNNTSVGEERRAKYLLNYLTAK